MHITSGITVQTPDGSFRKITTSLDWNDLLRLVDEKKVPGYRLGVAESLIEGQPDRVVVENSDSGEEIGALVAWDILRRWADRLVIVHMAADGLLSAEEAHSQIAELFPGVSG